VTPVSGELRNTRARNYWRAKEYMASVLRLTREENDGDAQKEMYDDEHVAQLLIERTNAATTGRQHEHPQHHVAQADVNLGFQIDPVAQCEQICTTVRSPVILLAFQGLQLTQVGHPNESQQYAQNGRHNVDLPN